MLRMHQKINFIKLHIQIGSYDDSDKIRIAINIDGEIVAMKDVGKFGRIYFDGSGNYLYLAITQLKYFGKSIRYGSNVLYQN